MTVAINGRPVAAYLQPYLRDGRVYGPLRPFVTALAYQLWYEGDVLVISRAGHEARIRLQPSQPSALDGVYVPLANVLRALGARVSYAAHRLDVQVKYVPLSSPTPFDATLPSAPPQIIFTPIPSPTPCPVWTGSPIPRRTPLPVAAPTPH